MMFDTGLKRWQTFDQWPPAAAKPIRFYLNSDRTLGQSAQSSGEEFSEFISDPADPVTEQKPSDVKLQFTPRNYMSDDQRFAAERPDVLTFQTDVLTDDVTLVGDIVGRLVVSTSETDSDWIVKLIDVYPDDEPNDPDTPKGITLAGYQMLVRGDVLRGRFRNSFEHPEPFVPNQMTEVKVPLQDIFHTFKKGHRIMVQVQSTWFPLIDRCPQKYVPNIFEAVAEDFVKATHRVYHAPADAASYIELRTLPVKAE
jgi:putative CocE/NonD family hydrolase